MARALSQELWDRVVAAICDGLSCRTLAGRLWIGVATAVRWEQLSLRHVRAVTSKPRGDQRSSTADKYADVILTTLEDRGDMTLGDIRAAPATQVNPVGFRTLHRFFVRHAITR